MDFLKSESWTLVIQFMLVMKKVLHTRSEQQNGFSPLAFGQCQILNNIQDFFAGRPQMTQCNQLLCKHGLLHSICMLIESALIWQLNVLSQVLERDVNEIPTGPSQSAACNPSAAGRLYEFSYAGNSPTIRNKIYRLRKNVR